MGSSDRPTASSSGSAAVNGRGESRKRLRKRGSGGVHAVRDGVWRVDVEVGRDPVTARRRRVSRTVPGSRTDAEIALARLRVADHEKRLPTGGTNARSVTGAFRLYQQAIDAGLIELAPSTVLTVRSASKIMSQAELADGRRFGEVRLGRLTWQDIEYLYAAMRLRGLSAAYIRRCATVLARALEIARKRGLIDSNPSKDAARPRTTRSKPYAPPWAGGPVSPVVAGGEAEQLEQSLGGDEEAAADAQGGQLAASRQATGTLNTPTNLAPEAELTLFPGARARAVYTAPGTPPRATAWAWTPAAPARRRPTRSRRRVGSITRSVTRLPEPRGKHLPGPHGLPNGCTTGTTKGCRPRDPSDLHLLAGGGRI